MHDTGYISVLSRAFGQTCGNFGVILPGRNLHSGMAMTQRVRVEKAKKLGTTCGSCVAVWRNLQEI